MSQIVVEIESLAPGGDAVGRGDEGRVTFVPLAAPGERVLAKLVREKERVAWGELVKIERPGPDRISPPCPLFGQCGGCQWQHVTLAAQHAAKKAIVERALGIAIPPVIAASAPFGYRDRAKLTVAAGRVGFKERRSHDVVDVPACLLFSPALVRALPAIRALGAKLPDGAEIAVQAGGEGVHVDVSHLDEVGAAHVRREFDELAAAGVVGLSLAGKRALGVAGVDVSEPGGPTLSVPAAGFAQVGRQANAILVATVMEAVGETPGTVIELCAGSGNFTRHLLRVATAVYATDADPAAIERGRHAAPRATWSLPPPDLAATAVDVVLLDPPREGADAATLATAVRARRRVVYVSCDPQTLSRDARRITEAGFRLVRAVALDLMPHTHHIEVVAIFDRP